MLYALRLSLSRERNAPRRKTRESMRKLFSYLEIASVGRASDDARIYEETIRELRSARIHGCDVIEVRVDEPQRFGDLVAVPDFGHTSKCECKHPQMFGVLRYLDIDLLIAGEPGSDI